MPALNFQKQFAPMILDLSKPHTIRPERKHPIKVGDVLMLYTGLRTKSCEMFACAPCTHVEVIKIFPHLHQVVIDDTSLGFREIDRLARRDGFQTRDAFFAFFMQYPREVREEKLRLIWWKTEELIDARGLDRQLVKDVVAVSQALHGYIAPTAAASSKRILQKAFDVGVEIPKIILPPDMGKSKMVDGMFRATFSRFSNELIAEVHHG